MIKKEELSEDVHEKRLKSESDRGVMEARHWGRLEYCIARRTDEVICAIQCDEEIGKRRLQEHCEQERLKKETSTEIINLKEYVYSIGRSQSCSLCVKLAHVSNNHCRLVRQQSLDEIPEDQEEEGEKENRDELQQGRLTLVDSVFLEDLKSSNGTFVNGKRLQCGARIELKSGDVIVLAGSSKSERFPVYHFTYVGAKDDACEKFAVKRNADEDLEKESKKPRVVCSNTRSSDLGTVVGLQAALKEKIEEQHSLVFEKQGLTEENVKLVNKDKAVKEQLETMLLEMGDMKRENQRLLKRNKTLFASVKEAQILKSEAIIKAEQLEQKLHLADLDINKLNVRLSILETTNSRLKEEKHLLCKGMGSIHKTAVLMKANAARFNNLAAEVEQASLADRGYCSAITTVAAAFHEKQEPQDQQEQVPQAIHKTPSCSTFDSESVSDSVHTEDSCKLRSGSDAEETGKEATVCPLRKVFVTPT